MDVIKGKSGWTFELVFKMDFCGPHQVLQPCMKTLQRAAVIAVDNSFGPNGLIWRHCFLIMDGQYVDKKLYFCQMDNIDNIKGGNRCSCKEVQLLQLITVAGSTENNS